MGVNLLGLLFFSITIALSESLKIEGSITIETDGQSSMTKLGSPKKQLGHLELPVETGGKRGEKGEKGEPGFEGMPGRDGPTGLRGLPGIPGQKGEKGATLFLGETGGEKGEKGEKGESGDKGNEGIPGLSGEVGEAGHHGPIGGRGEKGNKGSEGLFIPGMPGDKGLQGPRGVIGLPGAPGIPGNCDCASKGFKDNSGTKDSYADFGTEELPATVACKHAPSDIESGYYYFNRKEMFKAYCDMMSKTTCLLPNALSFDNLKRPTDYTNKFKEFWLSTLEETNIEDIYGLSIGNIEWLQKQSESVSLTLRYHCINSKPHARNDPSTALKMLTWNDIVIASYPTSTSPFYYIIPPETDGCQKAEDSEWHQTDITLTTKFVNSLPIKDFYVSDIRVGLTQKFYVELISLCFG